MSIENHYFSGRHGTYYHLNNNNVLQLIQGFSNLQRNEIFDQITINDSNISNENFIALLNHMPNTISLTINETVITQQVAEALGNFIDSHIILKDLTLKNNQLFFSEFLINRLTNSAIQELIIENNDIGDLLPALINSNFSQLKILKLQNCGIDENGAIQIASALRRNETLETISLANNPRIYEFTAAEFGSTLSVNHTLENIDLHGCNITLEGAMYLLLHGVSRNQNLQSLDIHDNPHGNPMAMDFNRLRNFIPSGWITSGYEGYFERNNEEEEDENFDDEFDDEEGEDQNDSDEEDEDEDENSLNRTATALESEAERNQRLHPTRNPLPLNPLVNHDVPLELLGYTMEEIELLNPISRNGPVPNEESRKRRAEEFETAERNFQRRKLNSMEMFHAREDVKALLEKIALLSSALIRCADAKEVFNEIEKLNTRFEVLKKSFWECMKNQSDPILFEQYENMNEPILAEDGQIYDKEVLIHQLNKKSFSSREILDEKKWIHLNE